MDVLDSYPNGRHDVCSGQPVVIVRMEIKQLIWEPAEHVAQGFTDFCRRHQTQGVRKQDVTNIQMLHSANQTEHIVPAVLVAVGPVL